MKKYGTAEYMMKVIRAYIDLKANQLTKDEKQQLLERCKNDVMEGFPSASDMEVL